METINKIQSWNTILLLYDSEVHLPEYMDEVFSDMIKLWTAQGLRTSNQGRKNIRKWLYIITYYINVSVQTGIPIGVSIALRSSLTKTLEFLHKNGLIIFHKEKQNKFHYISHFVPGPNWEKLRLSTDDFQQANPKQDAGQVDLSELNGSKTKQYESINGKQREELNIPTVEKFNQFMENRTKLNNHTLDTNLSRKFKHVDMKLHNGEGIEEFQCGRLYSYGPMSYQGLSKMVRKELTIDGEPIVEVDYSSMVVSMYYAMNNLDIPYDIYDIPGLPRSLVKSAMLRMYGAKSIQSAVHSLHHDGYSLKASWKIIRKIEDFHQPIKHEFYKYGATKMQRLDSDLMVQIMETFMDNDIPMLPIHDSVMVRKSDMEFAINVLQSKFESTYNKPISVTIEGKSMEKQRISHCEPPIVEETKRSPFVGLDIIPTIYRKIVEKTKALGDSYERKPTWTFHKPKIDENTTVDVSILEGIVV